MKRAWKWVILAAICASCGNSSSHPPADPDPADTAGAGGYVPSPYNIGYRLVNIYPHDTTSYTEGLLVHDGEIYESTGHTDEIPSSRSLFGVVDPVTGAIRVKVELDKNKYFGEGIVFLKGKIYQLTYKTNIGFVYDARSCKRLGEFTYPSAEGWGMTTDGISLIMSDSTPDLHWLDPETFKLTKTLTVTEDGQPIDQVNELEYIKGYIYGNRYTKNYIVKIDPATGKVVGRLDLSILEDQARSKYPASMEMNGIAYDSVSDKIYVTGKLWPDIYEIQFPH